MSGSLRLSVTVPAVALTYDKKLLRNTLRRAGSEIASVTRALILRAAGGGRKYRGPGGSAARYRGGYKPGAYTASAAGQSPVSVTGMLAKSVKVIPFKSGEGVAVRDTAFYAKFLETGAKGGGGRGKTHATASGSLRFTKAQTVTGRVLEARPFLTAALSQRQASLTQRICAAASDGVRFERIKA